MGINGIKGLIPWAYGLLVKCATRIIGGDKDLQSIMDPNYLQILGYKHKLGLAALVASELKKPCPFHGL